MKCNGRFGPQQGATVVEFALIVSVFLMFIFLILEIARLMFLYNTLQVVTRRAASGSAVSDFSKSADMDLLRQRAIFRTTPGSLVLMPELTDNAVRIDYLSLSRGSDGTLTMQSVGGGSAPSSPGENRKNCKNGMYAANCLRFVRVRICDPSDTGSCTPIKFSPLFSMISTATHLPVATTITPLQSLGATPN